MDKYRLTSVLIMLPFVLMSCKTMLDNDLELYHASMANEFDYKLIKTVSVKIEANLSSGKPIEGICYDLICQNKNIARGQTNSKGVYQTKITVPAFINSVTVLSKNEELQLELLKDGEEIFLQKVYSDSVFESVGRLKNSKVNLKNWPADKDKDGVIDENDQFPEDPEKSFKNIMVGTLAFEDMYPYAGDNDFNDLVLSYGIDRRTNSKNKISEIRLFLEVQAVGTAFDNVFGIEIPGLLQKNVRGYRFLNPNLKNQYQIEESFSGNLVLRPVNKISELFTDNYEYFNTREYSYVPSFPIDLIIELDKPIDIYSFSAPPFNPFLLCRGSNKNREVHLPGYKSTYKSDNEDYKNDNGLPWALYMPDKFDYPKEDVDIRSTYPHFESWAYSNGENYQDWYLNKSNYRNANLTYTEHD